MLGTMGFTTRVPHTDYERSSTCRATPADGSGDAATLDGPGRVGQRRGYAAQHHVSYELADCRLFTKKGCNQTLLRVVAKSLVRAAKTLARCGAQVGLTVNNFQSGVDAFLTGWFFAGDTSGFSKESIQRGTGFINRGRTCTPGRS
jgi:hypothetical protein